MKKLLLVLLLSASCWGQTLISTTTAQAVSASAQGIPVASASGITAGMDIYIDRELMAVNSVSGKTLIVTRGVQGAAEAHMSGVSVLAGQPQWFYNVDASGSCSSTAATPYVNVSDGLQFTCQGG